LLEDPFGEWGSDMPCQKLLGTPRYAYDRPSTSDGLLILEHFSEWVNFPLLQSMSLEIERDRYFEMNIKQVWKTIARGAMEWVE
jgi:hypothetical protein